MVLLLTVMGTNFAVDGFATASSLLPRGDPKHAIDGHRDDVFVRGSCSLTTKQYEPWWRLYFLKQVLVIEVVITKLDCCGKYVI